MYVFVAESVANITGKVYMYSRILLEIGFYTLYIHVATCVVHGAAMTTSPLHVGSDLLLLASMLEPASIQNFISDHHIYMIAYTPTYLL